MSCDLIPWNRVIGILEGEAEAEFMNIQFFDVYGHNL
jgi:hypothetical protein